MGKGTQGIMNKRKEKLLEELKSKEYRDAFVSELIDTGIPFQIRELRKQRNWTQKELSEKSGMAQERISVLEDPNYAKLTLTTLKRLASAFYIGILVRFVPISDLVKWELALSLDSLKAFSYNDDPYFKETESSLAIADSVKYCIEGATAATMSDNIIYIHNIDGQKAHIPTTQSVGSTFNYDTGRESYG
jgi:transcriptional regulator with XRE-family HTH domain